VAVQVANGARAVLYSGRGTRVGRARKKVGGLGFGLWGGIGAKGTLDWRARRARVGVEVTLYVVCTYLFRRVGEGRVGVVRVG